MQVKKCGLQVAKKHLIDENEKEPQIRLRINGSLRITVYYENYLKNDVKTREDVFD
ncbi:hypothetical protein ACVXZZ_04605 [Staphylococcus aureus]